MQVPIILIGHSMGGLVSKQAYIIGRNNPQNFASITLAIKGMLFLATPHAGSSHSKTLNKILGMVPSKGCQQYVRNLDISSVTIRTMDELFRGAMEGIMLASLYEVFPLKIAPLYSKMIVEKHHAILGVLDEIVRPMDANHRTICKFSSKQDPNYIALKNLCGSFRNTTF
ncbi:hypothetical protein L211DRAFT_396286 [Terfezia boudieri ATCC MYA-4762]|uniref:GPI inositol-deacylase n=1 Tax=Terfezia boudieri ATCC MYA-4762 TaxID=1051890 RepID=A0A3N4M0J9_9PEZI|nr:hypothetical protein L211DRAFT_396286 [Terfezia boudieri ATCC MYA-4762]